MLTALNAPHDVLLLDPLLEISMSLYRIVARTSTTPANRFKNANENKQLHAFPPSPSTPENLD